MRWIDSSKFSFSVSVNIQLSSKSNAFYNNSENAPTLSAILSIVFFRKLKWPLFWKLSLFRAHFFKSQSHTLGSLSVFASKSDIIWFVISQQLSHAYPLKCVKTVNRIYLFLVIILIRISLGIMKNHNLRLKYQSGLKFIIRVRS